MNIFEFDQFVPQIDSITINNGFGDRNSIQSLNMYGFNHRQAGIAIPNNVENQGMVLFTKPDLNLSYNNIKSSRTLAVLNVNEPNSLQRAVLCTLDPRRHRSGDVSCGLIDSEQAFVPFLSNTLLSLSGFPDVTMDTYTSDEGRVGEQWSMSDGSAKVYNSFELTANFRTVPGDPLNLMLATSLEYQDMVHQGDIYPHDINLRRLRIDYNFRIYRLIFDVNRQYVKKIAHIGAGLWNSNPTGSSFNYSTEKALNEEINQSSVSILANGAIYNDPYSIIAFNSVSSSFCPRLKQKTSEEFVKGQARQVKPGLIKLNQAEKKLFNFNGYFLINPLTYEFEIWVDMEVYASVI